MFFVCCQLQSMARAVLVSLCAFTRLVSDFKPPLKRSWRACLFVLAAIYFSGENNNRAPHIQCAPSRERERDKSRPRFVLRNGFAYFADVREIARRNRSRAAGWIDDESIISSFFRLSLQGECVGCSAKNALWYQLPSICQIWEREFNYLAPADSASWFISTSGSDGEYPKLSTKFRLPWR